MALENMSDTHHETDKTAMSQQRRLTIMIIVVVGVFIICNSVDFIWWIWKTTTKSHPPQILGCFTNFLQMFNCCVNVIIYAAFGKQFRKKFFELFCSPCQRYNEKINSEIPLKKKSTTKTDISKTSSKSTSRSDSVP